MKQYNKICLEVIQKENIQYIWLQKEKYQCSIAKGH